MSGQEWLNLMDILRNYIPGIQVEEDNDGQIVLYTGLKFKSISAGRLALIPYSPDMEEIDLHKGEIK